MAHYQGFPDSTPDDWRAFCTCFSPFTIEQVIDRPTSKLPLDFAPLARGVAIASDYLLREAGCRPGMRRSRKWRETSTGYFRRETGDNSYLVVRANDDTGLWTIERMTEHRQRGVDADEVLAFNFGWTPIFTRSYVSAMRLAEHCHKNGPRGGLRWVRAVPANIADAFDVREFVEKRGVADALAEQNAC
jgi:hypothetical protein